MTVYMLDGRQRQRRKGYPPADLQVCWSWNGLLHLCMRWAESEIPAQPSISTTAPPVGSDEDVLRREFFEGQDGYRRAPTETKKAFFSMASNASLNMHVIVVSTVAAVTESAGYDTICNP